MTRKIMYVGKPGSLGFAFGGKPDKPGPRYLLPYEVAVEVPDDVAAYALATHPEQVVAYVEEPQEEEETVPPPEETQQTERTPTTLS